VMSVTVCLHVCLSACISQDLHVRSSANFLCLSNMAVAQSSSGGAAGRYTLVVLYMYMTLCLHITARNRRPV